MIAFVKGKLVHKEATHVIIDVNGIGYQIYISLATFGKIKDQESCKLFTYFHVKEDSQALYGFLSEIDKIFFMDLISVSGIGPSTGMIMQSSMSTSDLKSAIIAENVDTIQSVKGIGAKTAQRVILELKDKIKKEGFSAESGQNIDSFDNNLRSEALSALVRLGINRGTAQKSIESVLRNSANKITLEQLIKESLQAS